MAERGGCPVKHPSSNTTTNGTSSDIAAQQQQSLTTSTADGDGGGVGGGGGGLWSSVASWIPFRGNQNNASAAARRQGGKIDPSAGSGSNKRNALETDDGGGPNASSSGCPVSGSRSQAGSSAADAESSGCPVKHDSSSSAGRGGASNTQESMSQAFNALNNEFIYEQERASDQEIPLSTTRQRSTIPKADYNPTHQPKDAPTWIYPSEQQYYNAIKRKGHNASARDMPSTLAIHNLVNEKGWAMVTEWERLHASGTGADAEPPKLLRFQGRPQDTSPKAWIKSNLMGYTSPFDRHDWVIQRSDGTEARYVIDFYSGHIAPGSTSPIAMHLDVRPALDSVDAAVDRARMFYGKEVRPYFAGILDVFASSNTTKAGTEDAPPPAPGSAGGR